MIYILGLIIGIVFGIVFLVSLIFVTVVAAIRCFARITNNNELSESMHYD